MCMREAEETLCIVGVVCVQHVTCCYDRYDSHKQEYVQIGCGLTEVPENIPAQARAVWLDGNDITHIRDGAFRHLTVCTELWLNHNALTEVRAGMWEGLSSLTVLSLIRNQISTIPVGAFNTLTSLTWLSLSTNQISTIPVGAFNTLSSLTELDLSTNQISTIPVGAFNTLTSLERLWLQDNELVTLEEGLFNTPLRTSLRLDLSGNPLQCDERMCWLKEAERVGHITWYTRYWDGWPQCKNQPGVHWDNITLNCEPGQSAHTNINILIEPGQSSH